MALGECVVKINEVVANPYPGVIKQNPARVAPAQPVAPAIDPNVTRYVGLWQKWVKTHPEANNDPDKLEAYVERFITPGRQAPTPTDMSPAGIQAYFTNIFTKPEQPTSTTQATQQRTLDPDVEIVSAVDPTILRFNGKRYTRQPNGQWTKLGQTKPLDTPMQQFLNKELKKL